MATGYEGVAPPGWEPAITRMKRHRGIDNPWALAWWLRKRGVTPPKSATEADAQFDREVQAALCVLTSQPLPGMFVAAARGEPWAHVLLLDARSTLPLLMETRW